VLKLKLILLLLFVNSTCFAQVTPPLESLPETHSECVLPLIDPLFTYNVDSLVDQTVMVSLSDGYTAAYYVPAGSYVRSFVPNTDGLFSWVLIRGTDRLSAYTTLERNNNLLVTCSNPNMLKHTFGGTGWTGVAIVNTNSDRLGFDSPSSIRVSLLAEGHQIGRTLVVHPGTQSIVWLAQFLPDDFDMNEFHTFTLVTDVPGAGIFLVSYRDPVHPANVLVTEY
jgi:hypothetical protein